jgi:DNA repair protein RadC
MRSILSNPADIPAELITDPSRPIPPRIAKSKRLLAMLRDLREAYQHAMAPKPSRDKMTDPVNVAAYLAPLMAPLHVEHLAVLSLNTRLQLLAPPTMVHRGDIDSVDAGPRVVFRTALVQEAASVIIAHNHPTGDPSPSDADKVVTQRCYLAGSALDLPLNDHVIIGSAGSFYSLRSRNPELWR